MFDWKSRFKNIILFWIPIIALFFSSAHIDTSTLTSWYTLGIAILSVFENPIQLACFFVALVGIVNNPATPGLLDSVKKGITGMKYMLKKDIEDIRDYIFEHTVVPASSVDLRPKMPPVFDQGQLGSCTANAGIGYMMYLNPLVALSRLYMYFKERVIEGTVSEDSGASIRDECKVAYNGVCAEIFMPYDINKFSTPPSNDAEIDAPKHKIATYKSVKGLTGILQALTLCKPVAIGMSVYQSFEGIQISVSGQMPIPKSTEEYLGGHAVLVVGFKDAPKQTFLQWLFKKNTSKGYLIVRNSWGDKWGDKGYFYMPYEYVDLKINGQPCTYDYWIME